MLPILFQSFCLIRSLVISFIFFCQGSAWTRACLISTSFHIILRACVRLYQKIYLSRVILDKSIFIFYHNARPYVRVQIISKEFFDTISSSNTSSSIFAFTSFATHIVLCESCDRYFRGYCTYPLWFWRMIITELC